MVFLKHGMARNTVLVVCFAALVACAFTTPVTAQESEDKPVHDWLTQPPRSGNGMDLMNCYPVGKPRGKQAGAMKPVTARTTEMVDIEPNDTVFQAQYASVLSDIGSEIDAEVVGSINPGDDLDFYRVSLQKGDVVGLAVVATDNDPSNPNIYPTLDPVVGIYNLSETLVIENDDGYGLSSLYPENAPWPDVDFYYDSALTWIVPADGDYLVRVSSYESSRNGGYTLSIVVRRPYLETQPEGTKQIIYLDFDGALDVPAVRNYGGGFYFADLSELRWWMWDWGLNDSDEAAVVQAIIDTVEENFDDVRTSMTNGDIETTGTAGQFDVEILNSRDHEDPFGQPNVSRVIIGGSIYELGISTIGIAEFIDPGNYATEDTAVVLLDMLSEPAGDPFMDASLNSIPLAPGISIIDLIGVAVGNIATHEAGHMLGLWHTDNANDHSTIIDSGGAAFDRPFLYNITGMGQDEIFGTADDIDIDFTPDEYAWYEAVAVGIEDCETRIAFALGTGTIFVTPDPPTPPTPATASIRATPTTGAAPLYVAMAGGGLDPDGATFATFNWNFGDGTTASGINVEHIYTTPGTYMATLTAFSGGGDIATTTQRITVIQAANDAPMPRVVATPNQGDSPLIVLFEAAATDADGVVVGYEWDFGDGSTGSGQVVEHVYLDPGAYGVVLTAIDDMGGRGVATTIIRVNAGPGATAGEIVGGDNAFEIPGMPVIPSCGSGVTGATIASALALVGLVSTRRRYRL